MKHSPWLFLLFLVLMSSGTCSRPPLEEDSAEIQVLGIYPIENDHFFVPLLKSKYVEYEYQDSLIFFHIDSSGNVLRAPAYSLSGRPNIENIYQLDNGNLIISGSFLQDHYYNYRNGFLELTPEGVLVQEKTFPERMFAMCPVSDGNIIYFGIAPGDSTNIDDLIYMKLSSLEDTLWFRRVTPNSTVYMSGAVPLAGGECLALGYARFPGKGNDMYATYINVGGDILWDRHYGGDRYDDFVTGIQLSDGDLLLAGRLDLYDSTNTDWSLNSGHQTYLVRVGADGSKRWSHPYGPTLRESPVDIHENSDGSITMLGYRNESYAYLFDVPSGWVMKIDAEGEVLHSTEFPSRIPAGMCRLPSGDLLIAAYHLAEDAYFQYLSDFSLIKVNPSGTLLWDMALTP